MSRSRTRQKRPAPPDRRRAATRVKHRPTADGDLMWLAHHAEMRMRFAQALDYLRDLSPRTRVPGWIADLERLLPDHTEVSPTDYARWLGHAAHRWATIEPDDIHRASLAWAFARGWCGDAASADDAVGAFHNPWVNDAYLFDQTGFDDYLHRLAPLLVVDACPQVRHWVGEPMRSLVCTGDVVEEHIRYVDEHSGSEFLVLEPAAEPPAPGTRVFARPLPVPGGAHIMVIAPVLVGRRRPEPHHLSSASGWLGWLGGLLAVAEVAA